MDEDIKENIEILKSDLQNLKDEVYEKGGMKMQKLKEKGIEKRRQMKEYVQTNPEKSILIALGAGLITGIIIGMLRRR